VKVDALIVAGAIAVLKVALSTCPMGTLVAPFAGIVDITSGAGGVTTGDVVVVKLHT